jgi:cytochrome P450
LRDRVSRVSGERVRVHFCLGAALARMEMNSLFSGLLPRLDSIELAGQPDLAATMFVGGLKHLPIRYSIK